MNEITADDAHDLIAAWATVVRWVVDGEEGGRPVKVAVAITKAEVDAAIDEATGLDWYRTMSLLRVGTESEVFTVGEGS